MIEWIGNIPMISKMTDAELMIYAKNNCRKCNGKGYVERSTTKQKWKTPCDCVLKRREKYV